MGVKQSKVEHETESSAASPTKSLASISIETEDFSIDMGNPDPRSPHICRTPLNEMITIDTPMEDYGTPSNFEDLLKDSSSTPCRQSHQANTKFTNFKNKLLKGLKTTNIFDPRSPSLLINRTPITFNDSTDSNDKFKFAADKSLNLNDSFSDLFINNESTIPIVTDELSKESSRCEKSSEENEVTVDVDDIAAIPKSTETSTTPPVSESDLLAIKSEECIINDPRSPSIGVERTPIIFIDDDTPDENLMIESVLEKLQLNTKEDGLKIQNKPLERIKNPQRRKTRYSARIAAAANNNKMSIYKDRRVEQVFSASNKLKDDDISKNAKSENVTKRTPLGCMVNKPHLRSKSAEMTRRQITSFDDYNLKKDQLNDENNSSMNNFLTHNF